MVADREQTLERGAEATAGALQAYGLTSAHWRALDALTVALETPGDTLTATVGPAGSGLEALSSRFLQTAPQRFQAICLDGAALSGFEVLRRLSAAVGAEPKSDNASGLACAFRTRMAQLGSMGVELLAAVTHAERLSPDTLALLAALARPDGDGIVRIALFGEPKLLDKMIATGSPSLEAAAARAASVRYATADETRALARRVLRDTEVDLDAEALTTIFVETKGAPELLAHLLPALQERCSLGLAADRPVDGRMVSMTAHAIQLSQKAAALDLSAGVSTAAEMELAAEQAASTGAAPQSVAVNRSAHSASSAVPAEARDARAEEPEADPYGTGGRALADDLSVRAEEPPIVLDGPSATRKQLRARKPAQRTTLTTALLAAALAALGAWVLAEAIAAEGVNIGTAVSDRAQVRISTRDDEGDAILTADAGNRLAGSGITLGGLLGSVWGAEPPAPTEEELAARRAEEKRAAAARAARVATLVALANRRMAAEQLTLPEPNSAYDALLAAWELSPAAPEIAAGFDALIETYEAEARQALLDQRFERFHEMTNRIDQIRRRLPN